MKGRLVKILEGLGKEEDATEEPRVILRED